MAAENDLTEVLDAVRAANGDAIAACDFSAVVRSREHGRLAATLAGLADFDPRRLRLPERRVC